MSRNYAEMTREELIEAIENEHGTATADDTPDTVLRSQLQALDAEKTQNAKPAKKSAKTAKAEASAEPAKTAKAEASAKPAKTVRIKLFGDKDSGPFEVFNVNGVNYQVKRQEEVDVPLHVFEAMNLCTITEFSYDEKTGALIPNTRLRFPFQVIPR